MPPPGRLRARYGAGLALAYLLTAAEVVAIVVSLSAQSVTDAQALLSRQNLIATVLLVAVGTAAVSVGGVLLIEPAVRLLQGAIGTWATCDGRDLTHWQSAILLTPWAVAAVVMLSLNADKGGARVMAVIAFAVMFGCHRDSVYRLPVHPERRSAGDDRYGRTSRTPRRVPGVRRG